MKNRDCGFFFLLFWFLCFFKSESCQQERVIAFDLHGVVLHYDWKALVPRVWQFPHKWQLIKKLGYLPLGALIKTIWSKPSFEQVLRLCGKNNPALKELLIDLSVQQKLATDVALLIKELCEQGHAVHVLSNVGAESYKRLSIRYAETFDCFTAVTTSNLHDEHDTLIKKPDPRFFEYYLNQQNIKPEQVLFVDDRPKNIMVARSLGMEAILFLNAQQLQKELEDRNLLKD